MASMEAVVLCPWTRSGRWRPPTCLDGRWWMVNTCHWSGGPYGGCGWMWSAEHLLDGFQYVSDVINPRIQIRPTSLRVKHWSPNILEGFLIYGFNNKGSNQWSFYAYSDHPNGWDIALPSPQRTMMEVQCLCLSDRKDDELAVPAQEHGHQISHPTPIWCSKWSTFWCSEWSLKTTMVTTTSTEVLRSSQSGRFLPPLQRFVADPWPGRGTVPRSAAKLRGFAMPRLRELPEIEQVKICENCEELSNWVSGINRSQIQQM